MNEWLVFCFYIFFYWIAIILKDMMKYDPTPFSSLFFSNLSK